MNFGSAFTALTLLPILAALVTIAQSTSPASSQAEKQAATTMLGPSDLRSFSEFPAPRYFRLFEPSEIGWSDYDWSVGNMLARQDSGEKRKRGAEDGATDDPPTASMGKRLFVARIGKRGRMMPIYRARVG